MKSICARCRRNWFGDLTFHQARLRDFGALVAFIATGEMQAAMFHCGSVEQLTSGEVFSFTDTDEGHFGSWGGWENGFAPP
jgi:hypothetical protein